MKSTFRGHYPPTESELTDLWDAGLVVLDTNALLNAFRYKPTARDEFLALLSDLGDRLWMPHHVGWEFHANRRKVATERADALRNIHSELDKAERVITGLITNLGNRFRYETEELTEFVSQRMEELRTEVTDATDQDGDDSGLDADHEQTFMRITELYKGKVGPAFLDAEMRAVEKEAEARYKEKIPPGYEDDDKEANRYGDYVIWRQILEKGEQSGLPVIFVTDDGKEDWLLREGGRTLGPRPELVEEYYVASGGKRLHLYSSPRFLDYARQHGKGVAAETVDEASKTLAAASPPKLPAASNSMGALEAVTRNYEELARSGNHALLRQYRQLLDLSKVGFPIQYGPTSLPAFLNAYEALVKTTPSSLGLLSAEELASRVAASGQEPSDER